LRSIILLAMHGAPPLDFPKSELAEFFGLHAKIGHTGGPVPDHLVTRYRKLEARVRAWPRTSDNDPFYAGSVELAGELSKHSGLEVILGFNEFCAPTLDEALGRAASEAERIIVITPMMTRGGEHAAVEIPAAIRRAKDRHPDKEIIYAWPFPDKDIASFLAAQVSRFLK
jgi:sirohydrochlorin cobaltochelatase